MKYNKEKFVFSQSIDVKYTCHLYRSANQNLQNSLYLTSTLFYKNIFLMSISFPLNKY